MGNRAKYRVRVIASGQTACPFLRQAPRGSNLVWASCRLLSEVAEVQDRTARVQVMPPDAYLVVECPDHGMTWVRISGRSLKSYYYHNGAIDILSILNSHRCAVQYTELPSTNEPPYNPASDPQ
jgi:hypothetical protein